jgi:hypothetical protein
VIAVYKTAIALLAAGVVVLVAHLASRIIRATKDEEP